MKRALALIIFASGPLAAQVPRAEAVDPALAQDNGEVLFLRGKNLYDEAHASTVPDSRIAYFQRAADISNQYLAVHGDHPNAEMAYWYL
ncbi:MAG: hypothetical protein EOP85_18235, partial [Verrucomicrobiaceae bacterium]